MRFVDRADAGRRLARAVADLGERTPTVLGIARGGVVVARALAGALGVPCDVAVARKLGAPGNPELAVGAVASGIEVLDPVAIAETGTGPGLLRRIIDRELAEVRRREERYRGHRPAIGLHGATVVLVDDGIATGATAIAAIRWARAGGAGRVVLAAPVASAEALPRLRREADAVVVLEVPAAFRAVGEWYDDFAQTSDADVVAALAEAA